MCIIFFLVDVERSLRKKRFSCEKWKLMNFATESCSRNRTTAGEKKRTWTSANLQIINVLSSGSYQQVATMDTKSKIMIMRRSRKKIKSLSWKKKSREREQKWDKNENENIKTMTKIRARRINLKWSQDWGISLFSATFYPNEIRARVSPLPLPHCFSLHTISRASEKEHWLTFSWSVLDRRQLFENIWPRRRRWWPNRKSESGDRVVFETINSN